MSSASPFCSGPGPSARKKIVTSTTRPLTPAMTTSRHQIKTTHGTPMINIRSPPSPEPRDLELEDEPHSDTAVDKTAGSSEPLATLPKDNDSGSEYVEGSDERPKPAEPAKHRRVSATLREVRVSSERAPQHLVIVSHDLRAPAPNVLRSLLSEGRASCPGRKRSRSQSEEPMPEPERKLVASSAAKRRALAPSKRLPGIRYFLRCLLTFSRGAAHSLSNSEAYTSTCATHGRRAKNG